MSGQFRSGQARISAVMCGSKAEGLVSWCGLGMTLKKSLLRSDLVVSEGPSF